jgi:putative PIN family toxin of toxin-antitoxin system
MLRVVLDTNVLVSAYLVAQGAPAQLRQAFRQGVFALVVTDAVLAEYRRVLNYERIARRHGLSPAEVDREIGELRQIALGIQVWAAVDVVTADPEDNVFLACALAGQAPFLVSGDPHLLRLGSYRGVRILTPAAFLLLLRAEGWLS